MKPLADSNEAQWWVKNHRQTEPSFQVQICTLLPFRQAARFSELLASAIIIFLYDGSLHFWQIATNFTHLDVMGLVGAIWRCQNYDRSRPTKAFSIARFFFFIWSDVSSVLLNFFNKKNFYYKGDVIVQIGTYDTLQDRCNLLTIRSFRNSKLL